MLGIMVEQNTQNHHYIKTGAKTTNKEGQQDKIQTFIYPSLLASTWILLHNRMISAHIIHFTEH